jgi:hypothetical protein
MINEYFICRDRSGEVYLYFTEPWRDTVGGMFVCGPGGCIKLPKSMPFEEVTWQNSPKRIKFEQVAAEYVEPEVKKKAKKTTKKKKE